MYRRLLHFLAIALCFSTPFFTSPVFAQDSCDESKAQCVQDRLQPVLAQPLHFGDIPQSARTKEGRVRVIVEMAVPEIDELSRASATTTMPMAADAALTSAIQTTAASILSNLPASTYTVTRQFRFVPMTALEVSAEGLARLQADPRIKAVYLDIPTPLPEYEIETQDDISERNQPNDTSQPLMADTIALIGADKAWERGYSGSGWHVAVLDTGIRRTHEFFQGKDIVEACFSQRSHCPNGQKTMTGTGAAAHYSSTYSGYDHGTHVAGIAVGNKPDETLFGVAKDADLIAVNVFSKFTASECGGSSPCVQAYTSDTLAGLEYVYGLRNTHNIGAVNMSLGGGRYYDYCDDDVRKQIIDNFFNSKIATIIATGNNSYCGSISSPSCISSAIGTMSSRKGDSQAFSSNWHSIVGDIFAPGDSINSSSGESDYSFSTRSGTSMAAPHVSGGMTILRNFNDENAVAENFSLITEKGTSITTRCADGGNKQRIYIDNFLNNIPLGISLDNTGLTWVTGGNAGWYGQDEVFIYGGSAARSGHITHRQDTWFSTTVTGPGVISFYWKVSSERWDYLNFYINDELQNRISEEVDWEAQHFVLPSGSHNLKWSYTKNSSINSGDDAAWVDKVNWIPVNHEDPIVYVTPNGEGDGSSWEDAYGNLQLAIEVAHIIPEINQVWVQSGIYKPTMFPNGGNSEREVHFSLRNDVSVYGGFSGNETELNERDYSTNETILSGDIGIEGDINDNAYHVFYHSGDTVLNSTALLDGFVITSGNANEGWGANSYGGGIYNKSSSPTLINLHICGNRASNRGGGIYNESSSPILENVTICDNFTSGSGGGIYNRDLSNIVITQSTISNNQASSGAGIYNLESEPIMNMILFKNNRATGSGGGIYSTNSKIVLKESLLHNNSSMSGGALYNDAGNGTIKNSTISNNIASSNGGGIYNRNTFSHQEIYNLTIFENQASRGGGIYNTDSSPNIRNSIFWGNAASISWAEDQIENSGVSNPVVGYSVIQDGYQGGTNIITLDPLLMHLENNGGYTKTHAIPANSSAYAISRDDGDEDWNGSPDKDQRGMARTTSGLRAIGAYEDIRYLVLFMPNGGTPPNLEPIHVVLNTTYGELPVITRAGYSFNGWFTESEGGTLITASTIVTTASDHAVHAQWTINTYTVTFKDHDGTTLETEEVTHGSAATAPEDPTRVGYTFTGWDTDFSNVTDNLTVTAQYQINTYTVTFKDHDDEELKTEQVPHGSAASPPVEPTREGHTFTGWDADFSNITGNLTVTAEYEINTYTVTFKDHDDEELKTEQVPHGSAATAPDDPAREGYTFTGWDRDFSNVTSDLTVTAEYEINTYTVTFKDHDDTELKTEEVAHGSAATAPDDPAREGYTFTGWDADFSNITGNLTVTAEYEINTYTVTFKDHDDEELKTEQVHHGSAATAPEDPAREGYTFTGWDTDFSNVTSDLTVTAEYEINTYTVTFKDHDNTELKSEEVPHGGAATPPADPTREGYTFTGWDTDFSNVTGNLTVTALYQINTYTVTFKDHDDEELITEQVPHGNAATAPDDPTREGYTFTGWDTDFSNVSSDLTVTAQYARNYTLTVTSGTGSGQYPAGRSVTITADAPAEGKAFDKWAGDTSHLADPESPSTTVTMPAENISVTAEYRDLPVDTFALTVINGTGSGEYAAGASVEITANPPESGKIFDKWTGDVAHVANVNSASTTVTMPAANVAVTATYKDAPVETFELEVISGIGGGTYHAGRIVTISAVHPPQDKIFDQWTGDTSTVANVEDPNTILTMPAENITVTAEYVDRTETLHALNVTDGLGSGEYQAGRVVAVAADLQEANQVFKEWTGDTARMANPKQPNTTLLMPNRAVSIAANFLTRPDQDFNLAVTSGTGSGAYPAGRTVRIVAYPREGQVFDKWVGTNTHVANVNLPSTSIAMPASDIGVEAVYKEPSETLRTITIRKDVPNAPTSGPRAAAARTLASITETQEEQPGEWVDLQTSREEGEFVFDRWVGQTAYVENVNLPSTRIWMPDHDVDVVAEYREATIESELTVNNGTADGEGPYLQGSKVTIMANDPEGDGMVFDQWIGQTGQVADISSASTSLFMPSYDVTVAATYKEDTPDLTFTVTPSAGANGSINPDTAQTIDQGTSTTFTVTPDEGYSATVGGTCGGTLVDDTFTTDPITEDCTVEATFTEESSPEAIPTLSQWGMFILAFLILVLGGFCLARMRLDTNQAA